MMILYIAYDNYLSRTAINKLLFFCDLLYGYKNKGYSETISNAKYIKEQYGPVPLYVDEIRSTLLNAGLLDKNTIDSSLYIYYLFKTNNKVKKDSIIDFFNKKEIEIMNKVLTKIGKETDANLSELSHQFEPWKSSDWFDILDFNKAKEDNKLQEFLNTF